LSEKLRQAFLMKTADLIYYIVWYATQRGMKWNTVRLVKFLYLADLFYTHGGCEKG
jgi:hypothetical protein